MEKIRRKKLEKDRDIKALKALFKDTLHLHELKITKGKHCHNIFIDGHQINTCRNLNFSIGADNEHNNGNFAIVNMSFLAKLDIDANVEVVHDIKILEKSFK